MYAKHLEDFVVRADDDIYCAYWKLSKSGKYQAGKILAVMDNNGHFQGVITPDSAVMQDFNSGVLSGSTAVELCDKNAKYILYDGDDEHALTAARNIFADHYPEISNIPVITKEGDLVDIISRKRAFWKYYYEEGEIPRIYYAFCIYQAALEARRLGYEKISVLEFGVAGGYGLALCEFHAEQVSRLTGVEIEVYGFDRGDGLPRPEGANDLAFTFREGYFKMDRERLENRLRFARLVIGDLNDTAPKFIEEWAPAPIGCMLVDVDLYSSTLPILRMLEQDDEFFLPRVYMYFDDIDEFYEFSGEDLAIREFNARNTALKISPEGQLTKSSVYEPFPEKLIPKAAPQYQNWKYIKMCHRFSHKLYNDNKGPDTLTIPLNIII